MFRRSLCGLIACWILAQTTSLVMWSLRCVVSCGNTSFSWLVFFFAALKSRAELLQQLASSSPTFNALPLPCSEFAISMVRHFGNALMYGNQHIYQAMPRMLSFWLDFGATVSNTERKDRAGKMQPQKGALRGHLSRLNKVSCPVCLWCQNPRS